MAVQGDPILALCRALGHRMELVALAPQVVLVGVQELPRQAPALRLPVSDLAAGATTAVAPMVAKEVAAAMQQAVVVALALVLPVPRQVQVVQQGLQAQRMPAVVG